MNATEHLIPIADGTRLCVEVSGRGPTLVLCDGLMCEGHVWKYIRQGFARRYRLVHVHYPGHGRSQTPPRIAHLTPDYMADAILSVLGQLDISKAVFLGHSYGVLVALAAALIHPRNVQGLILLNGSAGNIVKSIHLSQIITPLIPLVDMGTRFLPRFTSRLWHAMPVDLVLMLAKKARSDINLQLIDIEDLIPYFEGIPRTDVNTAVRMLERAKEFDVTPQLHAIDSPSLVVAGRRDRFVPYHQSLQMAHALPNCTFVSADAGTHSLPLEQPDLVNLHIKAFLEKITKNN